MAHEWTDESMDEYADDHVECMGKGYKEVMKQNCRDALVHCWRTGIGHQETADFIKKCEYGNISAVDVRMAFRMLDRKYGGLSDEKYNGGRY